MLVEDNLEDEQLLTEAFLEMEETGQWCNWQSPSIVHVEELGDAISCLQRSRFDAVLLNLSLPDSPSLLDSFHQVIDCARDAPIIVLLDEEDENLAHLLLREGAQDAILKPQIDCPALAMRQYLANLEAFFQGFLITEAVRCSRSSRRAASSTGSARATA